MSVFLGKTMTSLGSVFTPLGTHANLKYMFEKCLKARTKKEEEWLVGDCLQVVRSRLEEPSSTPTMVTRGLAFVVFADLLGYKSDFAHIHAVKLAQFGSLSEKKIGYLSCMFLMQPSDPLAVMLINTILRDLGSKNILVIAMAASASCYLIPRNLASTVLPLLAEKLNHPSEFLRGKTVIALQHFLRFSPEHCCHYIDSVCVLLGDKDPCVVGYVLQFLLDVAKVNKSALIKFIPFLVNIQYQILTGKLSQVYNYRGLLAPWIQITLLRLLQNTEGYTSEIADVSHKTWEMLKKGETTPIREALKIECLNTLMHCKNDEQMLNIAILYVEELLSSSSSNLRYTGLDLLQTIIRHYQINLTSNQQQVVLKYLEHPDPTVKHKTLNLLCVAANEKNVDLVCLQVADNALLSCGGNKYLQIELVKQAVELVDKFPNTSNYWHVAMLIRLLPLADEALSKLIQQRMKTALSSEREQNITHARQKVLQILRKCSESKSASTSVLEMFVWTLSHFGINSDDSSDDCSVHVIQEIVQLGKKILKHQILDSCLPLEIERVLISINDALTHIIHRYGISPDVVEYMQEVKSMAINNSYLHKYCMEVLSTLQHSQKLHKCLRSVNWYKEAEKFDLTLSFLDWFVCNSIIAGEIPYHPKFPKVLGTEESVPLLNSEFFLCSGVNSVGNTSNTCTSPVSSEKESCFGSCSSEDLKFCAVKSSGKEVTEVKVVWTKAGRVEDDETKTKSDFLDEIQQVPLEVSCRSSPGNLQRNFGKGGDEENHDPLETLCNEDFQKLSVKPEKS